MLLCVQLTLQIPLPSPEEPAPNSAPAGGYRPVEEARKLWNGAKKLARKTAPRVRRQNAITLENGMPPETEIGDNVTESAPKYILEVYRNLSYRPEPTEANTIRSLQTINTASGKPPSPFPAFTNNSPSARMAAKNHVLVTKALILLQLNVHTHEVQVVFIDTVCACVCIGFLLHQFWGVSNCVYCFVLTLVQLQVGCDSQLRDSPLKICTHGIL